jgi:hypothetical protein
MVNSPSNAAFEMEKQKLELEKQKLALERERIAMMAQQQALVVVPDAKDSAKAAAAASAKAAAEAAAASGPIGASNPVLQQLQLAGANIEGRLSEIVAKVDLLIEMQASKAGAGPAGSMRLFSGQVEDPFAGEVLVNTIERLVNEHQNLSGDVVQKAEQVESAQTKIAELLEKNQEFIQNNNSLLESRNATLQDSSEADNRLKLAMMEKEKMENEVMRLTQDLQELQRQHGLAVQQGQVARAELDAEKETATHMRAELQVEKEAAEQAASRIQSELDAADAASKADVLSERQARRMAEERLGEVRAAQEEGESRAIDAQIVKLSEELGESRAELTASQEDAHALAARLTAAQLAQATAEAARAEAEAEAQRLEHGLQSETLKLQAALANGGAAGADEAAERERLQQRLAEIQKEHEAELDAAVRVARADAFENSSAANAAVTAASSEVAQLQQKLAEVATEKEALEAKLAGGVEATKGEVRGGKQRGWGGGVWRCVLRRNRDGAFSNECARARERRLCVRDVGSSLLAQLQALTVRAPPPARLCAVAPCLCNNFQLRRRRPRSRSWARPRRS